MLWLLAEPEGQNLRRPRQLFVVLCCSPPWATSDQARSRSWGLSTVARRRIRSWCAAAGLVADAYVIPGRDLGRCRPNAESRAATKAPWDSTRGSATGSSKGATALAYAKAQLGETYARDGM
jgi:hypothetical protein